MTCIGPQYRAMHAATPIVLFVLSSLASGIRAQDPPASNPLDDDGEPMKLYAVQCSPCHGERGRGDGPAGRFLDPAPRDFTKDQFRLVSTKNGKPSDKDLIEAISAGIPGTAMLPFAHLGPQKVRQLIDVVRAFQRKGLRETLAPHAADEKELEEWVRHDSTPGGTIFPSPAPPDTVDSRARGRLHYQTLCAQCHGPDGRGTIMPRLPDSKDPPVKARDITQGVMKGGIEGKNFFHRIRCGMPGTPMPSVMKGVLGDDGVWDIVHYLNALMPAGAQALHSPQGWRIFVPKIEGELPTQAADERFQKAQAVHIALAPFRADEYTIRGVAVQAVHDGVHVIFRIQYADATSDVPSKQHRLPPDGFAVRVTKYRQPPVLPIPGLPLPLDRAIWLAGAMPPGEDPVFDHVKPRFVNPDRVCISPIGPEHVGSGKFRDRTWTLVMPVKPERAGAIVSGETMGVSFSVFDGSLRRGPLPVSFSTWQTLVFE